MFAALLKMVAVAASNRNKPLACLNLPLPEIQAGLVAKFPRAIPHLNTSVAFGCGETPGWSIRARMIAGSQVSLSHSLRDCRVHLIFGHHAELDPARVAPDIPVTL